jgi:hypothetical protein
LADNFQSLTGVRLAAPESGLPEDRTKENAVAEDLKEGAVAKLIGSIPALLIVLGSAFVTLSLTKGIHYNNWLAMDEPAARIAAGLIGVGLIAVGVRVHLSPTRKHPAPIANPDEYGITITEPRDHDAVTRVDVRGAIAKPPPDGYALWILRVYPSTEAFIFLKKARVNIKNHTWDAPACDMGGSRSGDKRELAAVLVGPAGNALNDYFDEVSRVYGPIRDELAKLAQRGVSPWLPQIPTRTPDMIECARVKVSRQ